MSGQTPSQTIGPFFHFSLPWQGCADLTGSSDLGGRPDLTPHNEVLVRRDPAGRAAIAGERIEIAGKIFDGKGEPVPDALIEIWQADAQGRYSHSDDPFHSKADPQFTGFGRAATEADGSFRFRTVRPGQVPGPGNQLQAPHIAVSIFARGMLKRLVTRIYFGDSAENSHDPILDLVPSERRKTLIAQRAGDEWRFNIVLQGADETVFFDI